MANKALVVKSTGNWYWLKNEKNELLEARLRGKFKNKNIKSTNPVAVGDWVEYEEVEDDFVITEIFPRKNYLIRKSVNLSKQSHIIAANIDAAFFIFTLKNPPTKLGFLDRFLVTCEAYDIEPYILFNKIDTYNADDIKEIESFEGIYQKISYTSLKISAKKNENLDEVQSLLKNKTSMFFGHSGSGKSSLINALQPSIHLKTQEVSSSNTKGQHTTTFAQMYFWDFGGSIIDTPGVREFGLLDMEKQELQDYFPEIFALKGNCKFYNCLHTNEPKCAVKRGVEDRAISAERYESYCKLLEECH